MCFMFDEAYLKVAEVPLYRQAFLAVLEASLYPQAYLAISEASLYPQAYLVISEASLYPQAYLAISQGPFMLNAEPGRSETTPTEASFLTQRADGSPRRVDPALETLTSR